jgi:hypothetical protein
MKIDKHILTPVTLLFLWLGLAGPASGFYDPSAQQWINRDPINEPGFELLDYPRSARSSYHGLAYAFLGNGPISLVDPFGLLRFDNTCKPNDVTRMQREFASRCSQAKSNNCFRCLPIEYQREMNDFCDQKTNPRVHCEDTSTARDCGPPKNYCGWTGPLGGIHICANQMNNPGCGGDTGCTLLHEGCHSVGGVGQDDQPTGDNRAYAIQKCAGCTAPTNRQYPPGY